ncbi:hypothetical protein QYE76_030746 [Lolium multiflorum]|uniref:CCHC-type domain-containing protein n=1 Tax=Lolium multiflorum TaxID=4521 RepID=A0AAD8QQA4_LOLMU|nr:hypothetical protein QYE76_030746 [Lolium multiflorum]
MIHLAITPKDRAHIRSLKTAKEAWDKLDMLFLKRRRSRSSCYNCGDKRHLVAECIYERRDEHDGKLVCKSEFGPLSKGLSKLSSNNNVIKISSTKKSRTNMQGDQDHSVDKLKAKKCHLEENHERSLEDVATFAKKKGDEGTNSCCDKLLDEVCLLRRHNAKFLEVISTQEKALNEYYHLSKEKVQCCDHEEEIATLKKHKAKLFEVNERQNESLLEWNRLSKDIASLEKHKCLLLRRNSLLEEALLDHEDEVNHLKSEIESLQMTKGARRGAEEGRHGPPHRRRGPSWPRRVRRAHSPLASFLRVCLRPENLSERVRRTEPQPPRGAENTERKELSAGRNPPGNSLPGEIDAIVTVIELDIISITITIIFIIITAVSTAAPRHRCSNLGLILIV